MIQDLMERILEILSQTYYGDVRYESNKSTIIGKNKSEENVSFGSSHGICVRVISNDIWYYLGFNTIDEEKIISEVNRLVKNVGKKKSNIWIQDGWEIDKISEIKEDPDKIKVEEKIDVIRDIYKKLTSNQKIVNASVSIGHSKAETIFMNTEGSKLRQVLPYFRFVMSVTSKEGKNLENDYFVTSKQGGYEIFKEVNLEEEIDKVVRNSIEMLRAKRLDGGRYDIIVDPEVSGVIAHESFGHGLEADQVMRNRSYLSNLLGKKIISDLVTVHDNPTLKGERGFTFFDDEGIKPKDNILVENGILKGFLHDRQSCMYMKMEPTGSARAQDFSRKVFVRMSNTYISPGDWKLEELIEDTKNGYYLVKNLTGMEDPLGGNMQMVTHKAFKIEKGELKDLYKGVTISGKVLEFLNKVDAVTRDFSIRGGGCGKGHEDYVGTSTGGPHMRVRGAIIG
ncbi:MAG: TldD/PmbA family protein [Candidatus Aenigmatarchaeota archaeon]